VQRIVTEGAISLDASSNNCYWKVRNSCGTNWGEAGFIKLAYGNNIRGLASYDATFVTVQKV
jgi:hypothetical protein